MILNRFMKTRIIIVILFASASLFSCSNKSKYQRDEFGRMLKNGQFYDSQEEETNEVWICTGSSSHAYHSNGDCFGLQNCSAEIEKISKDEAIDMGRTPCHFCHKDATEQGDPDRYDPLNDNPI